MKNIIKHNPNPYSDISLNDVINQATITKKLNNMSMAFAPNVLQAICSYINNDPMESNLTIVQGHTGDRTFTRADLVSFDEKRADFRVFSPTSAQDIRLPWQKEISTHPRN